MINKEKVYEQIKKDIESGMSADMIRTNLKKYERENSGVEYPKEAFDYLKESAGNAIFNNSFTTKINREKYFEEIYGLIVDMDFLDDKNENERNTEKNETKGIKDIVIKTIENMKDSNKYKNKKNFTLETSNSFFEKIIYDEIQKISYKILSERVKKERINKGYSQQSLAELIKKTKQEISKIECNKIKRINPDVIGKISDSLEVTMDYLMGFTDEKKPIDINGMINPIKMMSFGRKDAYIIDLSGIRKKNTNFINAFLECNDCFNSKELENISDILNFLVNLKKMKKSKV